MYENGNPPGPAASAGVPAKHHVRRVFTGAAVAFAATLGLSLTGIGAASAATFAAPAGGHAVASTSSDGGSGGGGSNGGSWDQTKIPLPHQPGQAPDIILQSSTVADVKALDQTSEFAADDSMVAFYQNNTACTAVYTPKPSVQYTITCPRGTATTTDSDVNGTWVHVFRLVH